MNSKRDIYDDGKIYADCKVVTPDKNRPGHRQINVNTAEKIYDVQGKHNWEDGEDVTGKWALDNDCELHPGCYCVMEGKDETQCKRYNPVAHEIKVALPTPPVPSDGAEAKEMAFATQEDIDSLCTIKKIIEKLETTDECNVDWANIELQTALERVIHNLQNFGNYFTKIEEKPGGFFNAECEKCGWFGSSEYCHGGHAIADTGDFSEVTCPICSAMIS